MALREDADMSESTTTPELELESGVKEALLSRRNDLLRRLEAIRADRRRETGALDPDLDDQAVQRENDATLDALDISERQELAATEEALDRLSKGSYGICVRCKQRVEPDRLRASPTAATCVACM